MNINTWKIIALFLAIASASSTSSIMGQNKTKTTEDKDLVIVANGVSFVMKFVQGGTFRMGSDDNDADYSEQPVHNVTVSSFYMAETEVTQTLWQAVMGSNPSYFSNSTFGVNLPVENVSWNDCQAFLRKLNNLTGKNFRLPTEAEWEFAARGGNKSKGCKYAGSNSLDAVAWYANTVKTRGSTSSTGTLWWTPSTVRTKQPNELGLYDMTGNVWEYCQDWCGNYVSDSQVNPQGEPSSPVRALRGGCYCSNEWACRVQRRVPSHLDYKNHETGLRLLLPMPSMSYSVETVPNTRLQGNTIHVSDPDGYLSDKAKRDINTTLSAIRDKADVFVVALSSIDDNPDEFATRLGNYWGIGDAKKNNGVLLLFVDSKHSVVIRTGKGMGRLLPDSSCQSIISQTMIPYFKEGDYEAGICAGVREIAVTIQKNAKQ